MQKLIFLLLLFTEMVMIFDLARIVAEYMVEPVTIIDIDMDRQLGGIKL